MTGIGNWSLLWVYKIMNKQVSTSVLMYLDIQMQYKEVLCERERRCKAVARQVFSATKVIPNTMIVPGQQLIELSAI